MAGRSFKEGWMDVDADPGHYVRLMDLARGGREDDPAMYRGLFGALAARARTSDAAAPLEFVLGDAHAMPFPDGSFDAAYSTRVFEIVHDPRRVLAEMARVLRPGGRLVVNGIDMDAWVIDSSERDVTRRILHYASDFETNGWAGRQLPGWCKELGLTDLCVTPITFTLEEFDTLYEVALRAFVENAAAAGAVTADEAARWVEDLRDRDRRGLFFCSQTFFRVAAHK